MHQNKTGLRLQSFEFDEQWPRLSDYVRHNPGSRHRRRLIGRALGSLGVSIDSVLDAGCGLGEVMQQVASSHPQARIVGVRHVSFWDHLMSRGIPKL
jgi:hypothetical protein